MRLLTSTSAPAAGVRAATIAAASLAVAAVFAAWLGAGASQADAHPAPETAPALVALEALGAAWSEELDELTAATRALAIADDTYDFIKRPNFPYVVEHYTPARLGADRIDTLLIINTKGAPQLWRRLNDRHNRGFPDAEAFLAELPKLGVPSEPGVPALAGAVRLVRGPMLVVAIPIYPASRTGPARGWIIAGRTLDAKQWHRYGERARVAVETLDPATSEWPAAAAYVPGRAPVPVAEVEADRIHGWLPVYDIRGERLRLFRVTLPRAVPVQVAEPAGSANGVVRWLVPLLLLVVVVAGLLYWFRGRMKAPPARPSRPQAGGTAATSLAAPAAAATAARSAPRDAPRPVAPSAPQAPPRSWIEDPDLEAMFEPVELSAPESAHDGEPGRDEDTTAAHDPVAPAAWQVLYQAQVDLQSGRTVGVEALICPPAPGEGAPVESAPVTLEAIERLLREACCERQAWCATIDRDFPVSVPVPLPALEDPAFVPLLRQALADSGLAPALLELEAPEAAFGSGKALGTLRAARELGALIAVDGFGKGVSSLKSLAKMDIGKVRIDATLVREAAADLTASAFVQAIASAARALRIGVCATGVDAEGQVATLTLHGRLSAQGAAVAKPVAGEQFLAMQRAAAVGKTPLPVLGRREAIQATGVVAGAKRQAGDSG